MNNEIFLDFNIPLKAFVLYWDTNKEKGEAGERRRTFARQSSEQGTKQITVPNLESQHSSEIKVSRGRVLTVYLLLSAGKHAKIYLYLMVIH